MSSLNQPVVCVQGLGFVGAAMAVVCALAKNADGQPKYRVLGVELATASGSERAAKINRGEFPFVTTDQKLIAATKQAWQVGNLAATTSEAGFAQADIIIVDVHLDVAGTPPRAVFEPFHQAIRAIGRNMKPTALVIVETTVPPGTCERVVAPILVDELSKRNLPTHNFLLAHSYERVMPGKDYLDSIINFWRVYAGHNEESAKQCEAFLSSIIHVEHYPLRRLSSMTASETAKILENSYRALNIAFIQEWSNFAEAVGIDLFEVIEAIRVRPTHNNIRQPGLGVGGYCLTKDPLFVGAAARELFGLDLKFTFSELAVATNSKMPLRAVELLSQLFAGSLKDVKILLLGVAYRPDVADTRYSPSAIFVESLLQQGAAVVAHDPLVESWPEFSRQFVTGPLPEPSGFDAIVFAVAHRDYVNLDIKNWLQQQRPKILDANGVLTARQWQSIKQLNLEAASVGRGSVTS